MLKYFSGLSLAIHWMSTPSNLPPSNAGIGSTLNIANAREIIPANPRYSFRPPMLNSVSQNFMAPAGPVSLLSDVFILVPFIDIKSLPNVPNAEKVSAVWAFISFAPIHMALNSGNLMLSVDKFPSLDCANATHNIQLSFGQIQLTVFDFQFLL